MNLDADLASAASCMSVNAAHGRNLHVTGQQTFRRQPAIATGRRSRRSFSLINRERGIRGKSAVTWSPGAVKRLRTATIQRPNQRPESRGKPQPMLESFGRTIEDQESLNLNP